MTPTNAAPACALEVVFIKDVENDHRLQYRDEILKEGIASMVCAHEVKGCKAGSMDLKKGTRSRG